MYNLEFNMRPGTPEFEVLVEHLDCDLLELLYKTAVSELKDVKIKYKSGYTGAVVVVHKDYKSPTKQGKLTKIKIPQNFINDCADIIVNTRINKISKKNEAVIDSHLRVFTFLKNDVLNPFDKIYKQVYKLNDKNLYYRTDIGNDLNA